MGEIGYYGFLATRIAPGRLLATAARRAAKLALHLSPPLSPPRERLLGALGCANAAALAALLSRPRPSRPPYAPGALREALERHLPGEAARALARAEDAAAGRLAILGERADVSRDGGGTDWQLDPIHGGRFSAWAPSAALPDAPGLDPRMAWAVGRGEQWVALAQGALLDERRGGDLAGSLAASVHDFAVENPVGHGVHWTSATEAALRAWNLLLALWLLSARDEPLDPDVAVDASRLFVATGRFVLAHLEDAVPDHRLPAQWLGLLACAEALPEWPESARWRALALAGLRTALREQVNEDGTSIEGALPYQRLAAEIFASGALLALAAGHGLPRSDARRLRALLGSTHALLASTGEVPQIGDADAGRVLALRERGPADGGHLPVLGAALLRDPALLGGAGAADAWEVAWLLGPAALDWVVAHRSPHRPGSASFPQGGFHVLRRGPFEAFVSCGASGRRGIGGRSHDGELSLELWANGTVAVCDPGSPAEGDPALRDAFRSARAHATLVVDGLEQALPGRPPTDAAGARLLAFERGDAARLEGEHRGFARAGVVHRREVRLLDRGVAVVDRLAGAGLHRVELRWPLATADVRARPLLAPEAAAFARLAAGAKLPPGVEAGQAIEVPLGPAGRLLVAFAVPDGLVPEVGPSLRSPAYGRLADGASVLLGGAVSCPAVLATLFLLLPGGPPPVRRRRPPARAT